MTTIKGALELSAGEMIVAVGGGGKTSVINRLARECAREGYKVLITTTTKMYAPVGCNLIIEKDDPDMFIGEIRDSLDRHGIAAAGKEINDENKVVGLCPALINALFYSEDWDVMLVEGDGAKGRSFKAPWDYEPVIPGQAVVVIPVVGADCIGKALNDKNFYCIEQVKKLTGLKYNDPVEPGDIAKVLLHENGYKKNVPGGARWIPFINKCDLKSNWKDINILAGLLLEAGTEKVLAGTALYEDPVEKIYRL